MRRYLPVPRVADHRALAVIDLAFFAGRRRDDDARLGRRAAAQRHDEAADARVPRGESRGRRPGPARSPSRCGRAPSASAISSRYGSQALALGARPGGGGRTGSVDTSALVMAGFAAEVGGHLLGNCRFCFRFARPAAAAHRDAGGFQIAADRLAPDAGRLPRCAEASSPSRPSARICCCLCVVQDVAHAGDGTTRSSPASTSRPLS